MLSQIMQTIGKKIILELDEAHQDSGLSGQICQAVGMDGELVEMQYEDESGAFFSEFVNPAWIVSLEVYEYDENAEYEYAEGEYAEGEYDENAEYAEGEYDENAEYAEGEQTAEAAAQ